MADQTPTPQPAPQPGQKPKHNYEISKADTDAIAEGNSIGLKSQTTAYVAPLAAKEVPATVGPALVAKCKNANEVLAPAVLTALDEEKVATQAEQKARRDVDAVAADMQGAVRRKDKDKTNKVLRDNYFIGKPKFGNDSKQYRIDVRAMLNRAGGDALPGFGATAIADGTTKVDAYEAADNEQSKKQQALGAAHAAFKAAVADIKSDTRDIKLGANRAFAHTDAANASIRRDLGLPENRNWLG